MIHPSDDELLAYAEDPHTVVDLAQVEEHLGVCVACREVVRDYKLLSESFRAEETWEIADECDSSPTTDLAAVEERRIREDAEAEALLGPYLHSHYRFSYADLATKKRFRTGGVVRRLCRASYDEVVDDALFAHTIATTAAAIATMLRDDYYPASGVEQLRGDAWKECATACRFLGRYQDGLAALDRAKRAFDRIVGTGLNAGIVDFSRAILLWDLERYEEALVCIRRAQRTFVEHADATRHAESLQTEAVILMKKGEAEAARTAFRKVYEIAEMSNNEELRAGAAHNLGVSYLDTDAGEASRHFVIALQTYARLGLRSEVVRARWGIGRVTLAVGNYSEAARRLADVVEQLEKGLMLGDANKARLDQAEALLMMEEWDEVTRLCGAVFTFFREANLLSGALTAASFLKEAAARRTLTRIQIRRVREYLAELERRPNLIFAPPPHK